jgi:hypothetical protein
MTHGSAALLGPGRPGHQLGVPVPQDDAFKEPILQLHAKRGEARSSQRLHTGAARELWSERQRGFVLDPSGRPTPTDASSSGPFLRPFLQSPHAARSSLQSPVPDKTPRYRLQARYRYGAMNYCTLASNFAKLSSHSLPTSAAALSNVNQTGRSSVPAIKARRTVAFRHTQYHSATQHPDCVV